MPVQRSPLVTRLFSGSGSPIDAPPGYNCFACTPPYEHPREWVPALNGQTKRQNRTLVLCFDGTGDSFDADNSNVVQFLSMLKKDDPSQQLVYYQAGIGTYTSSLMKTLIITTIAKTLDLMFAMSLADHIKSGYQFLMQNYRPGDKICIFGFSRGAFTARALAGMIQKVGLLSPSNQEQLPFAYDMYARDDDDGLLLSMAFKRSFSNDVSIDFLGVWDTVQSTGLISHHLPFTGYNNAVLCFRHALSLDERRVKFLPLFCVKPKDEEKSVYTTGGHERQQKESTHEFEHIINMMDRGHKADVEEVFFAGVHCDVGGGSVENGTRHSLARIPLRWMIRECFINNTGIIFDAHMLEHEVGLDLDLSEPGNAPERRIHSGFDDLPGPAKTVNGAFWRSTLSFVLILFTWTWSKFSNLRNTKAKPDFTLGGDRFVTKGEAVEEQMDALCEVFDEIPKHWYWRVMEWLPFIIKKQEAEINGYEENFWAYKPVWNMGYGRKIFPTVMKDGKIKVHRSVKTRIEYLNTHGKVGDKSYIPKIRSFVEGSPRQLTVDEWLAEDSKHIVWTTY